MQEYLKEKEQAQKEVEKMIEIELAIRHKEEEKKAIMYKAMQEQFEFKEQQRAE